MGSVLSRMGRVLLILLYAAGAIAGGFLLLCRFGVLSPAAVGPAVTAVLGLIPG